MNLLLSPTRLIGTTFLNSLCSRSVRCLSLRSQTDLDGVSRRLYGEDSDDLLESGDLYDDEGVLEAACAGGDGRDGGQTSQEDVGLERHVGVSAARTRHVLRRTDRRP